jgi:hypothetical protein
MADFFERTEELAKKIGDGTLRGEFAANRVYAVNMHEKGWRNFLGYLGPKEIERYHRGGGLKFVEAPLKEGFAGWYQEMADQTLEGDLEGAMEGVMKDLDAELQSRAPIDSGDLRNSGTYTVYDGERVARHKPSQVPYSDD